jgi:hypothetical protein
MVGSHEADDDRLTERVARAPRSRPVDDRPVEDGDADADADVAAAAGGTTGTAGAVAPADPEIETVTRLMGFLRSSDDG